MRPCTNYKKTSRPYLNVKVLDSGALLFKSIGAIQLWSKRTSPVVRSRTRYFGKKARYMIMIHLAIYQISVLFSRSFVNLHNEITSIRPGRLPTLFLSSKRHCHLEEMCCELDPSSI